MYNKIILLGRLVADAELKTTPNGVNVGVFKIAVDRAYKGKDGKKLVDFFNIVAWRNQGEFVCKFFSKGNAIGVEGNLQNRAYVDKDGNNRIVAEIITERLFFVGEKKKLESGEESLPADFYPVNDDGDLPF